MLLYLFISGSTHKRSYKISSPQQQSEVRQDNLLLFHHRHWNITVSAAGQYDIQGYYDPYELFHLSVSLSLLTLDERWGIPWTVYHRIDAEGKTGILHWNSHLHHFLKFYLTKVLHKVKGLDKKSEDHQHISRAVKTFHSKPQISSEVVTV